MNETNQEKRIGNLFGCTGGNYAGNVYDSTYICPTILTMTGWYRQPMIVVEQENIKYYCCRSQGRDPNNPNDRSTGNPNLVQRLEVNESGVSNTITSVAKDNYILVINDE